MQLMYRIIFRDSYSSWCEMPNGLYILITFLIRIYTYTHFLNFKNSHGHGYYVYNSIRGTFSLTLVGDAKGI